MKSIALRTGIVLLVWLLWISFSFPLSSKTLQSPKWFPVTPIEYSLREFMVSRKTVIVCAPFIRKMIARCLTPYVKLTIMGTSFPTDVVGDGRDFKFVHQLHAQMTHYIWIRPYLLAVAAREIWYL